MSIQQYDFVVVTRSGRILRVPDEPFINGLLCSTNIQILGRVLREEEKASDSLPEISRES